MTSPFDKWNQIHLSLFKNGQNTQNHLFLSEAALVLFFCSVMIKHVLFLVESITYWKTGCNHNKDVQLFISKNPGRKCNDVYVEFELD